MQCPTCKKLLDKSHEDAAQWFPFCSERCKLIDLGRWLDGKYQIPVKETDPEDALDDKSRDEDSEC